MKIKMQFETVGMALLCLALAACATNPSSTTANRPGARVAEYRELVIFSRDAIRQSLLTLDQLAAKPDPRSFGAFAESVRQLEANSISIRARSQTMEARGSVYFAEWTEHVKQIADEAARKAAEQRLAELKQNFDDLLASAHQARQEFDTFLPDLRRLRARLEQNPDPETIISARGMIDEAETSGRRVQEKLTDMLAELEHLNLPKTGEPRVASPAPATGAEAQRQAREAVHARLRELYAATQNARNYGDDGVRLLWQQFQALRKSYENFTATLTTGQAADHANEWAELGAGLDILQQAFDNYRQDITAGRTTATALSDLCRVLEQGGHVWLQNFNAANLLLAQGPIQNTPRLAENEVLP